MGKLITFRDVLNDRTTKICAKDPLVQTEKFIKFEQKWPINEEKSDDDKSSPSKKQKTDGEDAFKEALKKVNEKHEFSTSKYISVPLIKRRELNDDTRLYTFKHGLKSVSDFNLGIGQHILCGFMLKDGIVERPYAILRPTGNDKDDGTIDVLVKTAHPSEKDPGGTVSNIMDLLDAERGDEMLIRGPEGPISYVGDGEFAISVDGKKPEKVTAKKINFISGGTGMTPIYGTIRAILETDSKEAQDITVKFIDANPSKEDILADDKLMQLAKDHDRFELIHVLQDKPEGFDAEEGQISEELIKKYCTPPGDGCVTLVCGPPPMLEAAKKGLLDFGFKEDKDFFHY